MNKRRINLLIIILLLIVLYLVICIVNYAFTHQKDYSNTVFIGDFTKIEVKDKNIKIYNDNIKLDHVYMNFYFDGKEVEGYITSSENGSSGGDYMYIAHKEDGSKLVFDYGILGYTKDLKLDFKEYRSERTDDLTEVYRFFESQNISIPTEIQVERVIIDSLDIDEDGNFEHIYSVNLIESMSNFDSFIFMKKDDKYILLSREFNTFDTEYKRLKLFNIIDFNNDGNYEFVVSKMMSEYGPNYYELYNFDGNEFTKLGGE